MPFSSALWIQWYRPFKSKNYNKAHTLLKRLGFKVIPSWVHKRYSSCKGIKLKNLWSFFFSLAAGLFWYIPTKKFYQCQNMKRVSFVFEMNIKKTTHHYSWHPYAYGTDSHPGIVLRGFFWQFSKRFLNHISISDKLMIFSKQSILCFLTNTNVTTANYMQKYCFVFFFFFPPKLELGILSSHLGCWLLHHNREIWLLKKEAKPVHEN